MDIFLTNKLFLLFEIKKVVCWDCWSMALSEEILDNPNLGDVDCLHIESDEFIHDKHFTHIHHFTENLFNNIGEFSKHMHQNPELIISPNNAKSEGYRIFLRNI